MIVETKRLILRKFAAEDAEFVLKLENEPSFVSNIGDKGLKNQHDVERFILEGYWTNQERSGYGMFLAELKNGRDSIAGCGLLYRKVPDVTDIGFAFLPEYWNCGFAYEAAEAILNYGHSNLGINTIVGLTSEDNLSSINLLKKLGMDFEKTVKMSDADPGKEKKLATKLYLSAERVSREDEFEHHLQIARARNLGIEIQEFYLPELMWGDWKPRLEQYKQLLDGFDNGLSIHNAFYCIDHAGLDPEILRLTRMRYDYIFKIAQELGCSTIVSHFMYLPRYKGSHLMRWQEAEVRFWDPYINKAEKIGFVLALENTFEPGPETLVPIFDRLKSVHFKWNLDIGHVNAFAQNNSLAEWIDALHPRLGYMHVHNNHGEEDSHNPVMDGTIDFEQLFERLDKWLVAPIVATEIYGQGLVESIDYLEKKMAATRCYRD